MRRNGSILAPIASAVGLAVTVLYGHVFFKVMVAIGRDLAATIGG